MNKPLSLLVALIIIGVLFFSAYIIKNQSEKNVLIIDNTTENPETTLNIEQIPPNKADTVQSLAAVDATQTDTEQTSNNSTSEQIDTTFAAHTSTNNTQKATKTAKPSTAKLGNVVAVTPKQLAEQKLANKTATAQTTISSSNTDKLQSVKSNPTTDKPQSVKTPTISNNKATNKQVATATTVQYSITIGCFIDTKHQAQLKNLFKLKATENIRTAKHQTNNCWRYMTGNYVNSADAFKKLAELRKYDKDCQVVRISTKNNKETIEVYKGR